MKVLVVNSDSVRNRGDRAILCGNIALIRRVWPDAEIWSFSENVEQDALWYDIHFLPIGIYTLNPLKLLRAAWFARQCDVVLWGGGELLQDYTNKVALLYWALKMGVIRLGNRNLYGVFQGVGATTSWMGKALIVWLVNLTRCFLVRDTESADCLRAWGVRTDVVASFDPAIMLSPLSLTPTDISRLLEQAQLSRVPGRDWVGVGVRKWFHYSPHGWIPFRWKRKLMFERDRSTLSPMETNLARLCDWLVEQWGVQIVFFPMHLAEAEADAEVACQIMRAMKHSEHAQCVMRDALSPQEYLDLISLCRFFVGVRLHSTILATAAGVPALLFYYAEKGRRFFEQIGRADMAVPVQALLDADALNQAEERMSILKEREADIKSSIAQRVEAMRRQLCGDFRTHIKRQAEPKVLNRIDG